MNFLAHLHIAHHTHTSPLGALAGDFVRGDVRQWPEPMQTGIRLHRYVDSWVDQHPSVIHLRRQFSPQYRRVAGILLDMAFDHQLAIHWHRYHSAPLQQFAQMNYQDLLAAKPMPARLEPVLPRIAAQDWLTSYQSRSGIEAAIDGISRRLSRPQMLHQGAAQLWLLDESIEAEFKQFYPLLLQECDQWVLQQNRA